MRQVMGYLPRDRRIEAKTWKAQIREQMTLMVYRVMTEGSLYDPELAAMAVRQARGDLIEAIFLLRAYRTTLPRFAHSRPRWNAICQAACFDIAPVQYAAAISPLE